MGGRLTAARRHDLGLGDGDGGLVPAPSAGLNFAGPAVEDGVRRLLVKQLHGGRVRRSAAGSAAGSGGPLNGAARTISGTDVGSRDSVTLKRNVDKMKSRANRWQPGLQSGRTSPHSTNAQGTRNYFAGEMERKVRNLSQESG